MRNNESFFNKVDYSMKKDTDEIKIRTVIIVG